MCARGGRQGAKVTARKKMLLILTTHGAAGHHMQRAPSPDWVVGMLVSSNGRARGNAARAMTSAASEEREGPHTAMCEADGGEQALHCGDGCAASGP